MSSMRTRLLLAALVVLAATALVVRTTGSSDDPPPSEDEGGEEAVAETTTTSTTTTTTTTTIPIDPDTGLPLDVDPTEIPLPDPATIDPEGGPTAAQVEDWCGRVAILELTVGTMGPDYSRREVREIEAGIRDLGEDFEAMTKEVTDLGLEQVEQLEDCGRPIEGIAERTGASAP
jgi:hypothetical protein